MKPLVNKPTPALHLCTSHHCDGKHFPCGMACKTIHNLDITKRPEALFARWSGFVDQVPSIKWNRKVADNAKLATRTAKLASSALTTANAPIMSHSNNS